MDARRRDTKLTSALKSKDAVLCPITQEEALAPAKCATIVARQVTSTPTAGNKMKTKTRDQTTTEQVWESKNRPMWMKTKTRDRLNICWLT